MSKRISKNSAESSSEALDAITEWQSEFNLREYVEKIFCSIKKARGKKATWEQITSVLQEQIGAEITINADTIRQYYFEASKKKDGSLKNQRRENAKKRTDQQLSVQKNPAKVKESLRVFAASNSTTTEVSSNGSEDIESSFSLRSKRNG